MCILSQAGVASRRPLRGSARAPASSSSAAAAAPQQLCPYYRFTRFTYAHTLCGHHGYFANGDFDEGLSCHRTAIAVDPLHRDARSVIGTICFGQEKDELAEIRKVLESHWF